MGIPWEMSHVPWDGKCPMGWEMSHGMGQSPCDSVLIMSYLTLGFILFCFKKFFLVHFFLYKRFSLSIVVAR